MILNTVEITPKSADMVPQSDRSQTFTCILLVKTKESKSEVPLYWKVTKSTPTFTLVVSSIFCSCSAVQWGKMILRRLASVCPTSPMKSRLSIALLTHNSSRGGATLKGAIAASQSPITGIRIQNPPPSWSSITISYSKTKTLQAPPFGHSNYISSANPILHRATRSKNHTCTSFSDDQRTQASTLKHTLTYRLFLWIPDRDATGAPIRSPSKPSAWRQKSTTTGPRTGWR